MPDDQRPYTDDEVAYARKSADLILGVNGYSPNCRLPFGRVRLILAAAILCTSRGLLAKPPDPAKTGPRG